MRRIVIPQAARIIVPATGNQYIMLLKSTSLASAIGYLELLRITTDIYATNFRVVELLAVAGVLVSRDDRVRHRDPDRPRKAFPAPMRWHGRHRSRQRRFRRDDPRSPA